MSLGRAEPGELNTQASISGSVVPLTEAEDHELKCRRPARGRSSELGSPNFGRPFSTVLTFMVRLLLPQARSCSKTHKKLARALLGPS